MNCISDKELQNRVERLRGLIKDKGLNGIIVYSDEYRSGYCTYFTGYKPINVIEESPQTLILMENEDPILVIGRLNYYSAKETVWINKADAFVVNKPLLSLANIHALFFIVMELHPVYVKGFSGLSYPARRDLYSDSPYKIWRNISNRIYLPKPIFHGKGKS